MLQRKRQESSLDRLEREANNDFRLLADLGPAHFGTEHLLELREGLRLRLAQFARLQRLSLTIGATAGGWFLAGMAALRFHYNLLGQVALFGMILSIVGFIAGVVLLKARFESRGEIEHSLRSVEDELRRRGEKRPQKPRLW